MIRDSRLQDPPAGPWPEGPEAVFVGRAVELGHLEEAVRDARSGHGRPVFVTGESGSGKTALLAEFARRFLKAGPENAVAGGKCQLPVVPADPYLPFLEALRVLSGDPDGGWLPGLSRADQAARAGKWSDDLAEVVTEAGLLLPGTSRSGRRPGPGPPPGADGLPEQVASALHAFSLRRPLLLLIEDLQWADLGSISLLFRLGRQLARSRILLVASFRPEEIPPLPGRHPLERPVDELARYGGGEAFLRLGEKPDRDLLDALIDAVPNDLDARFRDGLFGLTEGQPLFTIEILRSLWSRGSLFLGGSGRWSVRQPIAWNELPARVDALVREQVETLDEPSRAVLEAASVEGVEFCAETVAAALRESVPQVVEILSGPLGRLRRLVSHNGARDFGRRRFSFYRFRHALVRNYLYGRLDEAERALRHDRAAAAMRTVFGETPTGAVDAEIRCEL